MLDPNPPTPPASSPLPPAPHAAAPAGTRNQLVLLLVMVALLCSVLLGMLAVATLEAQIEADLRTRSEQVLARPAAAIERLVRARRDALAARIARDPLPLAASRRRLEARLARDLESLDGCSSLGLISPSGRVLASVNAGDRGATAADPGLQVDVALDQQGAPVAEEGADQAPRPRLLARLRPEAVRSTLDLAAADGRSQLSLVDGAGARLLVSGDPSITRAPLPAQAVTAMQSELHRYTSGAGLSLVGRARPIADTPWYVVYEIAEQQAFASVSTLIARILIGDAVLLLVFTLLARSVTERIFQPLAVLSEAARKVSAGQLPSEIPLSHADDEIRLLTHTFNDMVHQLRRTRGAAEADRQRLMIQNEELQRANEILAQLSITDGLTKLHNHRYFQDHLTREIKRLSRTGEDLSMILLDMDDFKQLNDRYGHATGDAVLARVARLMNQGVRESDLLARYGGEEFVILAPDTSLEGAVAIAEKLRMSVESSELVRDERDEPIHITISCGVAQYRGNRKEFFEAADRALYRAKSEGKNGVAAESPL